MEEQEQPSAAAWLEGPGSQQTLIRGTCYLGRSASSNVVLADDKISRRHAMVHAQGQREFWLIDLGSANGTYLNGRRVSHPCQLADADKIRVGRHCFIFHHPKTGPSTETDSPSTQKTAVQVKPIDCWLLVADIEGSTQFIQRLPAEEGPGIVGRWLAQCKQIIDHHGGTINKFLGDGFFAYWAEAEDAAGSVAGALAALKLQQAREEPRFRLVVHYGKVFAGGGVSLGEESLMGNEVNFVFRLEKLASSLGVPRLLSQAAHHQLKSFLPAIETGRHSLPGFETEFLIFSF